MAKSSVTPEMLAAFQAKHNVTKVAKSTSRYSERDMYRAVRGEEPESRVARARREVAAVLRQLRPVDGFAQIADRLGAVCRHLTYLGETWLIFADDTGGAWKMSGNHKFLRELSQEEVRKARSDY